jgi:hypothetical protein
MSARELPGVAAVVSFIDCINRGDVAGLGRLMTADHRLTVMDEDPLVGREANEAAWRGYVEGFPNCVIYPHVLSETDGQVAVPGHTTGSHLGWPTRRTTANAWACNRQTGATRAARRSGGRRGWR